MKCKTIVATLSALFTLTLFATPKMSWVPADAEFVLVSSNDAKGVKSFFDTWRAAAKAEGIDFDKFLDEATDDVTDDALDGSESILNLSVADAPNAKHATMESCVLSIVLPKVLDGKAFEADPKLAEDFALYAFIENSKLDAKRLAEAVKALADKEADDTQYTQEGPWTLLTEIKDPDEANEPTLRAAYRLMDGGLIWTLGATPDITKTADALLAGTAPTITADNPLAAAFAPDVTQAKVTALSFVTKDIADIAKRAFPTPEGQMMLEMQSPLLFKTHDIAILGKAEDNMAITLKITADIEEEAMAKQFAEMLIGFKAMGAMYLGADPELKPLLDLLNKVNITQAKNLVICALTVTPAEIMKLAAQAQKMEARANATPSLNLDDDEDDDGEFELDLDDIEDIEEDEARRILNAL